MQKIEHLPSGAKYEMNLQTITILIVPTWTRAEVFCQIRILTQLVQRQLSKNTAKYHPQAYKAYKFFIFFIHGVNLVHVIGKTHQYLSFIEVSAGIG